MIRVAVSDTGIGVKKEEAPYLFDKFTRGKNSSKINTGGAGLGLHVGQRMINDLHGKIGMKSEGEGMGSTFFADVPIDIEKK